MDMPKVTCQMSYAGRGNPAMLKAKEAIRMKKLLTILRSRWAGKRNAYWASIRQAEQAHWDHVLRRNTNRD